MDLTVIILSSVLLLLAIALVIVYRKYNSIKGIYRITLNAYGTMLDIAYDLPQMQDKDEMYQKMLDYAVKLIPGAQYGSILIYNKEADRMEFLALKGYDVKRFSDVYLKKEELFLYIINQLCEPAIIINPLEKNNRLSEIKKKEILKSSRSLEYKSILISPMYVDGDFAGCISVDNMERTDAFSRSDIEIIRYITAHLEILSKNMDLVGEMKQHLVVDSLTGLFNRRYLNNLCDENYTGDDLQAATIVMIDMDNFKNINDSYGHGRGDEVLKYFSDLLSSRFRKSDSIIRFAGDEFLLVLNECPPEKADNILKELKKELENNPYQGIQVMFSYGISSIKDGSTIEDSIKEADKNMYRQKRANVWQGRYS